MDALKIIESIEELLYRIALWIVLLPRTLWFIVSRPHQIYPYVAAELEKEPEKRFEAYLSPVLLWVLAALIPHMMLLDLLAGLSESRVASESLWVAFMHAPWSTRLLVVSVLALSVPLAFSVQSLRSLSRPVNRTTLRLPFLVHCYCVTPAYIGLLPVVYFALRYDVVPAGVDTWIAGGSWTLIVIWLVVAESLVLARHHSISPIRAVTRAASYLVFAVVLLIALEIVVITLFQGAAVWGSRA
jgi:hypothetical protein